MSALYRFLPSPNLPSTTVRHVMVSDGFPAITEALVGNGLLCVHPKPSLNLPQTVNRHADMLYLHLGGNQLALSDDQNITDPLILTTDRMPVPLQSRYPDDCALNVLLLGNTIIGNSRASARIKAHTLSSGFCWNEVGQGYTRCSTAVVTAHAVITADISIAKVLRERGMDCLLIPPGNISLPGYNTGFIGGCCGKIAWDILAFTGRLQATPFCQDITAFCRKHGVRILELTDLPLVDIGGILPLTEYV